MRQSAFLPFPMEVPPPPSLPRGTQYVLCVQKAKSDGSQVSTTVKQNWLSQLRVLYKQDNTFIVKPACNNISFFQINPPYYVPLVEVVPAPWTDSKVVDQTVALMKGIGQSPVVIKKEVNGFILNRLQYAVIMEAWRLVEDGICSPEDVDTAMTDGLGLRYSLIGPFETMQLNANGIRDYCERYGANIETVCKEQGGPRTLGGETLDKLEKALAETMPLGQLNERRNLRDRRLAALAQHKTQQENENSAD
ncbi:lambda-crystallin-like [Orbicella faveolata]|uniref:lambda-crystallin-like n=1 Tax=Orbicella faveolata TaxID=48498 RepID=UPI0009E2ECEC|nr:lambda-crystallin-like [Orbicella faveolata]